MLGAQVAYVLFFCNASVRYNALLFYAAGQRRAFYHNSMPDDVLETMILEDPDGALETMFDGRFAFLHRPPVTATYEGCDPEEWSNEFHFDGADLGMHPNKHTVYDRDRSRLYLPFDIPGLPPLAVVSIESSPAGAD